MLALGEAGEALLAVLVQQRRGAGDFISADCLNDSVL